MFLDKKLIDSRFTHILEDEKEYEVVTLPAKELITHKRLDISVKHRLARHIIEGNADSYSLVLYKEHLKVISNDSFVEPGEQRKNSFEDYIEKFKVLISDIMSKGFQSDTSLIPLGSDRVPLDGAHRIAACAALGLDVKCIMLGLNGQIYDANFFKSRFTNPNVLNEIFLEYLKSTKEEVATVIEWPLEKNLKDIIKSKYGHNLIFSKAVPLSYNGVKNVMLMNYWGEGWLQGDRLNNIGIHNKAKECFKNGDTNFYWVVGLTIEERIRIKEEIRLLVDGSKHTLHSTDTARECFNVSSCILSKNSINQINVMKPELQSEFISEVIKGGYKGDKILLSGSTVLGAFGLRAPRDIDSFYDGTPNGDVFGSHNNYIRYLGFETIEFIYVPENYFYYFGVKFMCLDLMLFFKQNRGELKDKKDIITIENLIFKGRVGFDIRSFLYSLLQRLVFVGINMIKILGLKNFVKTVLNRK